MYEIKCKPLIFQRHLVTIHFNLLQEVREILNQLRTSFHNLGKGIVEVPLFQPLQHLRDRFVKSLMCEISTVMHITRQPIPNTNTNNVQLCEDLDTIGKYEQGYFLLNRIKELSDTLYSQYRSFTPREFLQ